MSKPYGTGLRYVPGVDRDSIFNQCFERTLTAFGLADLAAYRALAADKFDSAQMQRWQDFEHAWTVAMRALAEVHPLKHERKPVRATGRAQSNHRKREIVRLLMDARITTREMAAALKEPMDRVAVTVRTLIEQGVLIQDGGMRGKPCYTVRTKLIAERFGKRMAA